MMVPNIEAVNLQDIFAVLLKDKASRQPNLLQGVVLQEICVSLRQVSSAKLSVGTNVTCDASSV